MNQSYKYEGKFKIVPVL